MSVAPDVLFYMSILFVLLGAGEFFYGIWLLKRSDSKKKFTGSVLRGSGLGLMGAAAIFHFAGAYDWALIAGLVAVGAGSMIGTLTGMRFVKGRRETFQ